MLFRKAVPDMNSTSEKLSIIAYFLSEFDMKAVQHLGYRTRTEALKDLSAIFGRPNNYLKLRRDEFDALPESASIRRGYANRPPQRYVAELGKKLGKYQYNELAELVDALIENEKGSDNTLFADAADVAELSEEELERILNATDENATIHVKTADKKTRYLKTTIIKQLKKLYNGRCQICGESPAQSHGIDICEAHHIIPFSISQNNNASNIIVLCPNHHRVIHKLNPSYDRNRSTFVYPDGIEESVVLRIHDS